MTKSEKTITAYLLQMASDEFSNHGCNDFYLKKFVPDLEERRQLIKEYHEWNGTPKEYDPELSYEYFEDWALMAFMADKIRK